MSTRAIQFLNKKGVPFDVIRYAHAEKGAEFAANAIGFPLERTIKTLVVGMGDKTFFLVLMPGDRQLSLKRAAKAMGAKRAAMADTAKAERLTGYKVGGISPFGIKSRLSAMMDDSLMDYETVAINGGQRGVMLIMSPADITRVLECVQFRLSKE